MRNSQLLLLAGALAGLTVVGTAAADGNNDIQCNAPYYEAGAGMFIDPVTGIGVGEAMETTGKAAYGMPGNELKADAPYYEAGAGMFIDPVTGIGIGETRETTGKAAYGMPGNELMADAPYYEAGAGMFIDPVTGIGVGECIN